MLQQVASLRWRPSRCKQDDYVIFNDFLMSDSVQTATQHTKRRRGTLSVGGSLVGYDDRLREMSFLAGSRNADYALISILR